MAHGTYNNPRAGNNSSKTRMNKLANKYNANQQQKAEKRTRKSELIGEFGRNIGKAKFKTEYASDKQKKKAQQRTSKTKLLSEQGIETKQSGYAKRRSVLKTGSVESGDYKKVVTTRGKQGDVKKVKTTEQITPKKQYGVGDGTYIVKKQTKIPTANYSSESRYTKKGNLGNVIAGAGVATIAGLMGASVKKHQSK
tara:strand:- start:17 stop:604 length:588 start_codon:yes stop_codon:yes gene_type:complete